MTSDDLAAAEDAKAKSMELFVSLKSVEDIVSALQDEELGAVQDLMSRPFWGADEGRKADAEFVSDVVWSEIEERWYKERALLMASSPFYRFYHRGHNQDGRILTPTRTEKKVSEEWAKTQIKDLLDIVGRTQESVNAWNDCELGAIRDVMSCSSWGGEERRERYSNSGFAKTLVSNELHQRWKSNPFHRFYNRQYYDDGPF